MISIIMPVMDKVNITRDCLKSIKANSIVPQEIILIDNGSTESSRPLQDEFRDLNILYTKNDKNIGVNKSWNLGVSYSSQPYLLILNNDTVLNKYFIEKILSVFDNYADVGICIPVREHSLPKVNLTNRQEPPNIIDAQYIEGWAFTIRKSLYEKLGHIPTDLFKTYMGDTFLFEGSTTLGFRNVQITNSSAYHYGSLTIHTVFPDYYGAHREEDRIWRQMRNSLIEKIKQK